MTKLIGCRAVPFSFKQSKPTYAIKESERFCPHHRQTLKGQEAQEPSGRWRAAYRCHIEGCIPVTNMYRRELDAQSLRRAHWATHPSWDDYFKNLQAGAIQ